MKNSSVFQLHRGFEKGREILKYDPRSGQPKTQLTDANVDTVRGFVRSDRELAELNVGISSEGRARILEWKVGSTAWHCPCAWCVKDFESSWLTNPLRKWAIHLIHLIRPLRFMAPSKIKIPTEGTKICWHSYHPTQHGNRSGKRFSRLFPAVVTSSHEGHSFTNSVVVRERTIRTEQSPLVGELVPTFADRGVTHNESI
jgi:hypothetical protein